MTVRGGDKIAAAANEIDNIYFIPSAPALLANRHTRYKYANYIIDVGGVYRTVLGRERVATMTAASSANERVSLSDAVFFFFCVRTARLITGPFLERLFSKRVFSKSLIFFQYRKNNIDKTVSGRFMRPKITTILFRRLPTETRRFYA